MCGIASIFSKESINLKKTIDDMVYVAKHRGPDAVGHHIEDDYAFGHARLSIIDLNKRSNQPFYDKSGRYIIVFNGEIYNFIDIKSKIGNKYKFLTSSDTEVLLAAFIIFGKNMLDMLNGCFSFSIYDQEKKELFFARDRLGIKPLYYYYDRQYFIISSELRQILSSGLIRKEIDNNGINQMIQYQSTKAPSTIIRNIKILNPGSFGKFYKENFNIEIKSYYKPKININNYNDDYNNIIQKVKNEVIESIEKRMIADVDVAAFLSGGIDSSIIVSMMSKISDKKINTFSLVHEQSNYDESYYSDLISDQYKTNHYKVRISKEELLSYVSEALDCFDSPSADGLNSYMVSKKIKEHGIKVAISGLGGDELFSGYPQFKYWYIFNKLNFLIPKKLLSILLTNVNKQNYFLYKIFKIISSNNNTFQVNDIFRDVTGHLGEKTLSYDYKIDKEESFFEENNNNYLISQYTIAELLGYTSNVLLKDADQTSMANSVEVRVPFMDHELVDYVLSLPDKLKKPIYSKKLLIDAFKEYLPNEVYSRKKQGFNIPIDLWMKDELYELSNKNIEIVCDSNLFNKDFIHQLWNEYNDNSNFKNGTLIWSFVVLGNWINKNNISCY